ncbi:MAG: PhoPQ-activated pathogenicity-like protein PqaA type [Candidatus Marinimicrobia bacterium]|nr:PhoPQ-activated pathogenicity-like protein PqaA type [Candidatus Neomarinimicrobiota bacterium]
MIKKLVFNIPFILFLIITISSCEKNDNNQLKEYVHKKDSAFKYEIVETLSTDTWKEYKIKMVSGTWLTEKEVNHTEWWHWITIIVPNNVLETEALLIIGGGSSKDREPKKASELLINAALETKSIVAEISNIPFQPLNYTNDSKHDRYEDDLIAYGWRKFLEGGAKNNDVTWLARLPMTRAVVKGMDVIQKVASDINIKIDEFVVAGASKRGWTTWTTAIADDRVIAIVPIVIDLLNVVPSFDHHWRCYGEWSPAIDDYVNEGITEWMGSKEYNRLLELVEPYSFTDQILIPKFLINATGDEFFVTDSWKFYWDRLIGDKYLQYVPNGNHGLTGTYNPGSLVAFYNAIITNSKIPEFNWSVSNDSIYLEVNTDANYTVKSWEAINENTRDFRVPVIGRSWKSDEINITLNNKYYLHVSKPKTGYKAGLLEITIDSGGKYPFVFTTGTLVSPKSYPFIPFKPRDPKGKRIK